MPESRFRLLRLTAQKNTGDTAAMRLLRALCVGLGVFAIALPACRSRPATPPVILATTTSVGNSGLLDVILNTFEQQQGRTVRAHLVGSGLALNMLARGDADVVISHAPAAEASALRDHPGWDYRKIMFNEFVLVGPPSDPALVKGARDAPEAMRRIATSSTRFLSRGDRSGTHEREEKLWSAAGVKPPLDRLVSAGTGMGSALRIASETGAYTLTDSATFAQHASTLSLVTVFNGGSDFLNTYAVIVGDGARAPEARAFADWLSDGAGRDVIGSHCVKDGSRHFSSGRRAGPASRPMIFRSEAQPSVWRERLRLLSTTKCMGPPCRES